MKYRKIRKDELNKIIVNLYSKKSSMCNKCGEKVKVDKCNSNRIYCTNKICPLKSKKINVWGNTIFNNNRIKKSKALQILELFMQKARNKLIAYILRINPCTVRRILKKVSEILVPSYYKATELLGGDSQIIEIDESKFGKRKYIRGHHVDGVWILGMIEKRVKKE